MVTMPFLGVITGRQPGLSCPQNPEQEKKLKFSQKIIAFLRKTSYNEHGKQTTFSFSSGRLYASYGNGRAVSFPFGPFPNPYKMIHRKIYRFSYKREETLGR